MGGLLQAASELAVVEAAALRANALLPATCFDASEIKLVVASSVARKGLILLCHKWDELFVGTVCCDAQSHRNCSGLRLIF